MNYTKHLIWIGLLLAGSASAQDYFDDLRGNGNPVSLNLNKTFNISARLNTGDGTSAKLNLFKMFHIKNNDGADIDSAEKVITEDFTNSAAASAPISTFRLFDVGLGTSLKGKTKDGLGDLFTKGNFGGESQWGLYGVVHKVKIANDHHKHTYVFSPFINFTYASYRVLPDTSVSFKRIDTTMNRRNVGFSFFRQGYIRGRSQFIVGGSLTFSKLNNYDDLKKAELKEFVTRTDSIGHTITTIEDKGYTYAVGNIKEYKNTNLKVYCSLVPFSLEYRAALILYPSIDFNKLYSDPLYNVGLGVHFLEKGNPSISALGLFFELNDIDNSKQKTDPFIKRSFKIGITTALNITSLIKKEK